jgi:hypothetical protein
MRKSCAQPVEAMSTRRGNEQDLYSASTAITWIGADKPPFFHQKAHTKTTDLSTLKMSNSNLVSADLSTFYTGLITNTTKYIFNSLSYY